MPPIRRVAIILPSGPPVAANLEAGIAWLQRCGVDVVAPRMRSEGHATCPAYLADTDDARAEALAEALCRADVDAVWAGRGGVGAFRTLQALPGQGAGAIAASPQRPLIGLSDITALLLARLHAGATAVHGPVVTMLAIQDRPSQAAIRAFLRDPDRGMRLRAGVRAGRRGVAADGTLVAGNLALLAGCCGLPEQPRLDGALLLVEDVGEPDWRIDRFMAQLERAGALRGLRGLGVGDFGPNPLGAAAEHTLLAWADKLGIPALCGLPLGHRRRNVPLPLGRPARLLPNTGVLEVAAAASGGAT